MACRRVYNNIILSEQTRGTNRSENSEGNAYYWPVPEELMRPACYPETVSLQRTGTTMAAYFLI